MLVLQSDIREPTRLAFSPDGQSIVAGRKNALQVWTRWLDKPPRAVFKTENSLERIAFSPDAAHIFQYLSGDSRTRILRVSPRRDTAFGLPDGPTWFHFTTEGGFFIVSHGRGELSRFDHAPTEKQRIREVWTIDRTRQSKPKSRVAKLGSHYHFGDVCGPAGVFITLEYKFGRGEVVDGLVVRSVADGSLLHHKKVTRATGLTLVRDVGLKLTIHPSGKYLAYPKNKAIRFWSLTDESAPREIISAPRANCHAVAFHPSGSLLAAVGADQLVRLYDTATWKVVREFAWDIGPLHAVCFSADGTRAATIGRGKDRAGGKIVVWDVDL